MDFSDFEDDTAQKTRRKYGGPRKLMRWDAEKDQLLLLTVDNVCAKKGIQIPWEDVAKEISPDLSGEAVKQHLAKVRHYRAENGQVVPAKLEKRKRRKTALTSATALAMPVAKGSRAKKVKEEGSDEEDGTGVPIKGRSLLHIKTPKQTKTPKGNKDSTDSATTTRRGGGRKKAHGVEDGEIHEEIKASTGKRGRKKEALKKEEDENSDHGSPTKKPKTRRQAKVNYYEGNPEGEADDERIDPIGYQADVDNQAPESHAQYAFQTAFASSQGSTLGEMPPHSSQNPQNSGFQQDFMYNGASLVGAGAGQPPGLHMNYKFDNSRGFNGLPSDISNAYGVFYSDISNFDSRFDDPAREQDLRNAISTRLPAMYHETVLDATVAPRTPRKKTTKVKGTPKTGTPKTNPAAISTPKPTTHDHAASIKIETSVPKTDNNSFDEQNRASGAIPIMNGVGYDNGSCNVGYTMDDTQAAGLDQYGEQQASNPAIVAMNINNAYINHSPIYHHGNAGPSTPVTASPSEIFGGNWDVPVDHTGVTPGVNNMSFGGSSNSQLTQFPSHSSSFDSVSLSQSNEAWPSIEQADAPSFGTDVWDPLAYEQAMPGDEFVNMGAIQYDVPLYNF